MALGGFLFGGNTGESYTSLQRRRAMADALAAQVMGAQPKNTAEGVGALLKGIGAGIGRYRADKAQEAGTSTANNLFNSIIGGGAAPGGNGAGQAASIGMPGAAAELAASSPSVGAADVSKNGSTFMPFIDTVKAGGLTNPFGLAAVAATGRAESGWDSKKAGGSWADPSESGQAGTSGGVMSWRAERLNNLRAYAARKGEQGNGSIPTQAEFFLAENPSLIARLNSAKSVEEAQGMMNNAWKFAGYNRPGGEAGRRQGYANGYVSQFQGGTQVASLDPSAGMNTAAGAIDAIAPPSGAVAPQEQAQAAPEFDPNRWGDPIKLSEMPAGAGDLGQRLGAQANAFVPPQPQPQNPAQQPGGALPPLTERQVGSTPSVASQPPQMPQQQAPMQVAQATPQVDQRLYQLLTNPFLDEDKKAVVKMMLQQQMQAADPVRQMELRKGQLELQQAENGTWARLDDGRLYNQRTGEVRNAPTVPGAPPTDLGLNPQYGVDAQGNPVILQLGKNGRVVQSQMPNGVSLSKEPIKLDAGTHFVLLDPITRQPVGNIPKENREAAAETAQGTAEGKAAAEARTGLSTAQLVGRQITAQIDSVLNDPNLDGAVGSVQGRLPSFTQGSIDFDKKLEQLQSQSFLQAREFLKGQGPITDYESRKAETAMAQLSTAQSEAQFRQALRDFREAVSEGVRKAEAAAAGGTKTGRSAGPVTIGGYKIEEVD